MSNALKNVNRKVTVQTKAARADQVANNAGGYVFEVTDKTRLERFLILGTDGGTYYASESKITDDSVKFLSDLIKRDEDLVRNTLVDVSVGARAYKNSPAIFALALLFVEGQNKAAARAVFNAVVRTSTHLFEFAQYIENLGGWGRAKRAAVAQWYESKSTNKLAYQLVKYRQRNGWTHKDMLRLSHPTQVDPNLAAFALGKPYGNHNILFDAFNNIQNTSDVNEVVTTLYNYPNLPWETVPTEFLTDARVWKQLFYNDQLNGQALLRNVKRLVNNGAFNDMQFARDYADKLVDVDMIERTRLHPMNYLLASVAGGASGPVADALDAGFDLAFKFVEPAGKRTLIGLDVSGSMGWTQCAGAPITPAEAGAAMAMTIARTEPMYQIHGFTGSFVDLGISAKDTLKSALGKTLNNFGRTDCALPMIYAKDKGIEVDHFCILTDNETWAGKIHPYQALRQYQDAMGIDARVSVVGMTATDFSIADGSANMLDVVGFDANTPKILADFAAHRI